MRLFGRREGPKTPSVHNNNKRETTDTLVLLMKRETKISYLAVLSAAAGPSCSRSNSKQTEAHFTHKH